MVLMMVLMMDVSRGLRRNDRLDDLNLDDDRHGQKMVLMTDVSHGHRMNVTDDRNDRKTGVNLCHRMNDLLDDRRDLNLVVKMDVSRGHRMNDLLDDRRDLN
jgi:hypothetical protein